MTYLSQVPESVKISDNSNNLIFIYLHDHISTIIVYSRTSLNLILFSY